MIWLWLGLAVGFFLGVFAAAVGLSAHLEKDLYLRNVRPKPSASSNDEF